MLTKPNLIYTIAIDPPGYGGTRQLAKMLAASLVRTYFSGEVVVFRNSEQPLFLTPRQGLEEIYIEIPEMKAIVSNGPDGADAIGRPWLEGTDALYQSSVEHERGQRAPAAVREWGKEEADALARVAMSWKYRARHYIDAKRYGWVMFVDADCLALRNLDHLLPPLHWGEKGARLEDDVRQTVNQPYRGEFSAPIIGLCESGDADILYQPECGRSATEDVFSAYLSDSVGQNMASRKGYGINSGTWAVRGEYYQEVMVAWEKIERSPPRIMTQWTEQGAWNRLIFEISRKGNTINNSENVHGENNLSYKRGTIPSMRTRPFETAEVQFPLHLDKDWKRYRDAALLHAVGGTTNEKIEFLFGMYMQRFYGDPATTLVNILEM